MTPRLWVTFLTTAALLLATPVAFAILTNGAHR